MSDSQFHQWMRSIGINLWFGTYFILFSAFYNVVFVYEDRPPIPELPSPFEPDFIEKYVEWWTWIGQAILHDLGFYQLSSTNFQDFGVAPTLVLFVARMYALIAIPIPFYKMLFNLLFSTPPNPEVGLDQLEIQVSKSALHCLVIRIVTRGDEAARPLIMRSVRTAVKLVKHMCHCDHLKVHIVTQTSFLDQATKKSWIQDGATDVQEILVPPNYKSKDGSLYKARNLCYWQDAGGIGTDCDHDQSWILSLDEESVITKCYLESFINDVLKSKNGQDIGYALGPAIMDIHTASISFINQMLEARWVAQYYGFLKCQPAFRKGIIYFHGGAYFVRAHVEAEIGNDWGPEPSVAEDFATGIRVTEKQIGFRYLNGWFIENTSPNLRGLIRQRARLLRGQIYCILKMPMSIKQKLRLLYQVLIKNLLAFVHLAVVFTVLYSPSDFMPSGPRCVYLDAMLMCCVAAGVTMYAFGAAYMGMGKLDMLKCIALSPFMVMCGAMPVEAVSVVEAFWNIGKDWMSGSVSFEVTVKAKSDERGCDKKE